MTGDIHIRTTIRTLFRRLAKTGSVFAFLTAFTATAATLTTSLSSDSLTVGDRIEYTVTLTVPKNVTVVPPEIEQDFGILAVKDYREDQVELDRKTKRDTLVYRYMLTTYKVEPCSIPALPYVIVEENIPDTIMTKPVPLRVHSVITADTADLKDLKPQQVAGNRPLIWLWIGLALYVITGFILGAKFHWGKRRWVAPPPPPKPPYEEAIMALKDLETKQYLKQGHVKPFTFGLSDILKRYISRRYDVFAAEYTTGEMLEWLEQAQIEPEPKKKAQWFFKTSDPIKFARYVPDMDTLYTLEKEARNFVEKTRPDLTGRKEANRSDRNQPAQNREPSTEEQSK
ncbi:MAG: hypothetical protein GF401_02700 [Chitinivibrionales bacterium]|nr:hypothetical protein [Chitinivibrionales bacterium]